MASISAKFANLYRARREMSNPADLARLFMARLCYPADTWLPATVTDLVKVLKGGRLKGLTGHEANKFAAWLHDFIVLGQRKGGASFYPIHPVLSRPLNREESRADGFILTLVRAFSSNERQQLVNALWGQGGQNLPPFERVIYDLVEWQIEGAEPMPLATIERAKPSDDPGLKPAAVAILDQTREDLLVLAGEVNGVQSFIDHAGRLLALALARFFPAQADVDMTLPIYIAPAADSHDGVRALAHEAIEVHRALFGQALHRQFEAFYQEAVVEEESDRDPLDAEVARKLTKHIFHPRANVVPLEQDRYDDLREDHSDLCGVSYYYYWRRSGAGGRFLRRLHTAQLNLSKKAGIANSRNRYSAWHYYWLASPLVETLLLVSRPRLERDRMLVVELLRDWRDRYGLALLIDDSWEDVYHTRFRGLGNPEALNEANQRRFNEILSERGRLHKNSDDFPWVILRD
ncbi:MAG: hypothetical protein E3J21_26330 [Anaerolineales bacterium]|nr:MAG: hypothetical protein E3J21_26330 [Anaerolineales bacterium]